MEQLLERVKESAGEVEILICWVTVAELAHGIYRANALEIRERRRTFIDELKRNVPVHSLMEATAEIIGRISGEQAAKGIKIPFEDLAIGAAALDQGYALATPNLRHFQMIPGLA